MKTPISNRLDIDHRRPYGLASTLVAVGILAASLSMQAVPVMPATDETDELDQKYTTFLNKDAVYIMLPKEREKFLELRTDRERDAAIENFWEVRDPIAETLANEFRDEHYKRMKEANQKFREARQGWRTERGQMYITIGPPSRYHALPEHPASRPPRGLAVSRTRNPRSAHGSSLHVFQATRSR